MSLMLRRDRRKAGREAAKQRRKNPWDRPLPDVNEDDPHSVQAGLHQRLGDLHGLTRQIERQDRELQRQAMAMHDYHRDHADHLHAEIQAAGGPGADPILENAHAHHLAGRQVAEEVLATLRKRLGSA